MRIKYVHSTWAWPLHSKVHWRTRGLQAIQRLVRSPLMMMIWVDQRRTRLRIPMRTVRYFLLHDHLIYSEERMRIPFLFPFRTVSLVRHNSLWGQHGVLHPRRKTNLFQVWKKRESRPVPECLLRVHLWGWKWGKYYYIITPVFPNIIDIIWSAKLMWNQWNITFELEKNEGNYLSIKLK